MTSPATHRPRHARADAAVPGWPTGIEVPTQRIPVVAPAPPGPHGPPVWGPYGAAPIPPAGLPVGHPPIGRSVPIAAIVSVMLVFAVVALIALVALVDGSTATGGTGSDVSTSSSTSDRIAAWRDGGGLGHMVAIGDDLGAISDAAGTYDVSGMTSACRSLQRDVESAQAYDPVPDAQVQSSWSSALGHGARAATYCIAGTTSMDAGMIEMSATEMGAMGRALDEGTARLDALDGS